MERVTETEALIVRTVNYREADRIVTFLTGELGKIGSVAYGARRSKRRFAGALQPFQLLRVMLKQKRGRDLLELVDGEVIEAYRSIPADAMRYACASYALELYRELTPDAEPDPTPLNHLKRFLRLLDQKGASASIMAGVVLNALSWAGFAPALEHCAACGRPAPPERGGHFETNRGVVCAACGGSGPVMRGRARLGLIQAAQWQELSACTEAELAPAAQLLCSFAHEHVGKEMRSWSMLGSFLKGL